MKPVILFDFDGTIADSICLGFELINSYSEKFHYHKIDLTSTKGLSALQLMKLAGIKWWKLPYLVFFFRNKIADHSDKLSLCSGVKELIIRLHDEGYELGILTSNSLKTVQNILQKNQLSEAFSFFKTDVSLFGKAKALKKSKKLLNKKIIYAGDEIRDIEACRKNQIPLVSVSWGFNSFDSLEEKNPGMVAKNTDEAFKLIVNTSKNLR